MDASQKAELNAFVDSLGLEYAAAFIPQSMSRNAGQKDKSLNWTVKFHTGKAILVAPYTQGIGHVPGYIQKFSKLTMDEARIQHMQDEAAETGKYPHKPRAGGHFLDMRPLPIPDRLEVLYCLVNDAFVLQYSDFTGWAVEHGYDPDSRKAEAIYNECRKNAMILESMIGRANLDKLTELFQDY